MYNDYGYNEYSVMNSYSYAGPQYNNVVSILICAANIWKLCFDKWIDSLQPFKCALPYRISLKVGSREYIADGTSAQAARHKAAKKALDELYKLEDIDKSGRETLRIQLSPVYLS